MRGKAPEPAILGDFRDAVEKAPRCLPGFDKLRMPGGRPSSARLLPRSLPQELAKYNQRGTTLQPLATDPGERWTKFRYCLVYIIIVTKRVKTCLTGSPACFLPASVHRRALARGRAGKMHSVRRG